MEQKNKVAKNRKLPKEKNNKVAKKPVGEVCLSPALLRKYNHTMAHGNPQEKTDIFLILLCSPWNETECDSREMALKTFERKYKEIDPSKDIEYIKNSLTDIITDEDIPVEKSYPVLLEKHISNILSGKSDLENLHLLIYQLVIDVYFLKERKDLISWPEKVMPEIEKGRHKIIINAPMGLGKTYQIAKALALSKHSAVVFMPTKKMRDEIYNIIKLFFPEGKDGEVLLVEGIDEYNCKKFNQIKKERERHFTYNKLAMCANCDWYDFSEEKCKTLFQDMEISNHRIIVTTHAQYTKFYNHFYWHDPSLEEDLEVKISDPLVKAQLKKEKYISKKGTPGGKAKKTFNALGKELKKDFPDWDDEVIGKVRADLLHAQGMAKRDFFVIDEDIATGLFLDCKDISYGDFEKYYNWIQRYPEELHNNYKSVLREFKEIIETAKNANESSYIMPIAKGFSLSFWDEEKQKLNHSDAIEIGRWCGKGLKEGRINKVITSFLINSFSRGCTCHHHGSRHELYFNDSKSFPRNGIFRPLDPRPPHIFFDATKVSDLILNKVFPPNEKLIPRIKLESVRPLGKVTYYHVNKTDLPKGQFEFLAPKIDKYLKYIVWRKKGISKYVVKGKKSIGYFAVTKKSSSDTYSRYNGYSDFVKECFKSQDIPVVEKEKQRIKNYAMVSHFGYLRGVNEAKNCTVGILLGTWIVPEAVEVIWAFPFLEDRAKQEMIKELYREYEENKYVPIEKMKQFLNSGEGIIHRKYTKEFKFIEQIAQWKRDAENEQALGRTRSLFHDVVFYLVTKDSVDGYSILSRGEKKEDRIGNEIFRQPEKEGDEHKPGAYINSTYIPVMLALDEVVNKKRSFTREEVEKRANMILSEIGEEPIKGGAVRKHIKKYVEDNNNCIEYDERSHVYNVFPEKWIDPDDDFDQGEDVYDDEFLDDLEDDDRRFILLSVLQKAIRRGEINMARYFARQMIKYYSPRLLLNRLETISAEDIGFADPTFASYLHRCYAEFEECIKKKKIPIEKVYKHREASSIVDRATIAAVLCYKCRLLDCAIWIAWYSIYLNEPFDLELPEYKELFLRAVKDEDREKALHYAYIIRQVFEEDESVFDMIKSIEGRRNEELIDEWIAVYKNARKDESERLLFAGIVLLLFHKIEDKHGEYLEQIDRYISEPIEKTDVPDWAYDKHTAIGRRMGRRMKHFIEVGSLLNNKGYENDWEDKGNEVFYAVERERLDDPQKLLEAIEKKYEERKNINNPSIIFQDKGSKALNLQKVIGDGCPFNCSPYVGCLAGCRYCYTQGAPFSFHGEFGQEVKVKMWFPEQLNKELAKYSSAPQHLKRIQINEACEYYHPDVLVRMERETGRDLMAEILDVLKDHWDNGNRWMLHVVTKSHHVLRHLEKLADMRHMVQVEVTMICLDEERRKSVEPNDFTIPERLNAIWELSRAGVFVRVMAMPLFGERGDAERLRDVVFENGARAFKHKALNYFTWEDVLAGNPPRKNQRNDTIYRDLLVNSGELALEDGRPISVDLLMPKPEWAKRNWYGNLEESTVEKVKFGYSELNDVNWGYVV